MLSYIYETTKTLIATPEGLDPEVAIEEGVYVRLDSHEAMVTNVEPDVTESIFSDEDWRTANPRLGELYPGRAGGTFSAFKKGLRTLFSV